MSLPPPQLKIAVSARSLVCLLAAAGLSIVVYLPERMLDGELWIWVAIVDFLLMRALVRMYARGGPILCALFFMFSYYLAPLPYLLFGIPIVPYTANVSVASFVRTLVVMSAFLAWLAAFSSLSATRMPGRIVCGSLGERIQVQGIGVLGTLFWLAVVPLMALTFKGESISNVSGVDNYQDYIENLQSQNGALEYFLILVALGKVISRSFLQRVFYVACVAYYLYFSLTRGYRVQLLEMLALLAALHFPDRLTVRNVVLASIAGFLVFQAIGFMKTGASDMASLFTVMAGEEIRSNQTEVFYTSNNVLHAVFSGAIPIAARIQSLAVALLAIFVPGGMLPETWQTTLSAQSVVFLEAGGGGFIAGHFYYWLSIVGPMLAGLIVTCLFRAYERARTQRMTLLTTVLLATFPRWVAYEPIAMFFRFGVYFVLAYELVYRLQQWCAEDRTETGR
jgi:hypothetical protein